MSKRFAFVAMAFLALSLSAGAQGRKPAEKPAADAAKDGEKKEETVELNFTQGLFGVATGTSKYPTRCSAAACWP